MITLYQLPPAFELPVSVSPYCAKLEAYLRLTGREYQTAKGDVFKSPNKKVPYVKWPEGGLTAESDAIIARLEAEGPALDQGLDPAAQAEVADLIGQVEGVLYYACLYARFVDPAGWAHQKPTVRALVPWLLSPILVPVIRRSQVKLCAEHGFADPADHAKALPVVDQLASALGDQDFLLGDTPRVADCAVWGHLMHTAYTKSDNPTRAAVRARPALMAYIARVADRSRLDLPAPA